MMKNFYQALISIISAHFGHGNHIVAGHIAYVSFLSLFPFLIVLTAMAGLLGTPEVIQTVMDYAFEFLPPNIAETLRPIVEDIFSKKPTGYLTLGLVGMIWTASSGVEAIREGVSRAYSVTERRRYYLRRLQGITLMFTAGAAMWVLTLVLIVGPLVLKFLETYFFLPPGSKTVLTIVRYGFALVLLVILATTLYQLLPNVRLRWRNQIPGALIISLIWLVIANQYAYFVQNLGSYSAVYGSLAGVITALLFFYISSLLFLFGAEINAYLINRTEGTKASKKASNKEIATHA